MQVDRTIFLRTLAVAAVLAVLWLALEYSPGRQLEKAFTNFIAAAGNRNWKVVKEYMAEDYLDQWGQDRSQAVERGQQVFQHFIALEIQTTGVRVEREGRDATVAAHLRLVGKGTAIGEMVMEQANSYDDEFQFAWKRKSWKPWDWRLVSLSQPEIKFDPSLIP